MGSWHPYLKGAMFLVSESGNLASLVVSHLLNQECHCIDVSRYLSVRVPLLDVRAVGSLAVRLPTRRCGTLGLSGILDGGVVG